MECTKCPFYAKDIFYEYRYTIDGDEMGPFPVERSWCDHPAGCQFTKE